MTARPPFPDFNQYGLKDEDGKPDQTYANRDDSQRAVVGPADAVNASGHRLGKIEERPARKPSSRMGQAVIGETDDKKR